MSTPDAQLKLEYAQHQQHLANVQQLQQNNTASIQATPNPAKAQANLDLQRQILQNKLAEKSHAGMASPTDSMMSPCSKQLQKQKNKNFAQRGKPKLLKSAFAASSMAQQAEKDKENEKSSSDEERDLFGAPTKRAEVPKDEPIF